MPSLLVRTALVAAALVPPLTAQLPGPRPDGSILLPNGWSLRPHGRQIDLPSDLPVRAAWSPDGAWLAVQHAGYRDHMVSVLDGDGTVVATLPVARTWSGMAWSRDGRRLYVSGGADDVVHGFARADDGTLTSAGDLAVGDPNRLDLVAGLATAADGSLLVCLQRTHRLVRLASDGTVLLDVALPDDSYPFEVAVADDGVELYVSLWAQGRVLALDAADGAVRASLPCGPHPTEMALAPDGKRLFVSNANENTVSVIDLEQHALAETISSALYPMAPPGSTPNSIALDADGETLWIANADNNDLAVVDVGEPGHARGRGFVPVGAYPTSVRLRPGTGEVWVANGKGSAGSHANPKGPQPVAGNRHATEDYTGGLFGGSLSMFESPSDEMLRRLTAQAYRCAPLQAAAAVRGTDQRPADSPIPAAVGDPSPIRYVVYIVKENRTYDQMLGDVEAGNGDPDLCLFPAEVTPNHHAIAGEFVLLDNFYVESEVSADGHEWTMAGYATDFVERTWPVTYGGKGSARQENGRHEALGYPAEGAFEIAEPEGGYLFDLAAAAGVSYRSYGEFVHNGRTPDDPGRPAIDVLEGHIDPGFRSFDLDYRDVDRADRFLGELAEFEQGGDLPRLIVLRLPNDHTAGTRVGIRTPRAYVADNDLALGQVLEGLSRSRFWPQMAVFVVEDDAQNGPDHVDAHRTVALLAGPYVARGKVVSTMYSTCSMLRTIELILGLPPMSQFDAAARPMFDGFTAEPDLDGYRHRPATWDLDERNAKTAWGAALSEQLDLAQEDAADDLLLGEIVWRSVRGAASPMPRPRRAAFVRAIESD